jgi:hypothetical protein
MPSSYSHSPIGHKYGIQVLSRLTTYKGSEDNDELGLEVTGWAWNKRTKTKTMMVPMRTRVKGSMFSWLG